MLPDGNIPFIAKSWRLHHELQNPAGSPVAQDSRKMYTFFWWTFIEIYDNNFIIFKDIKYTYHSNGLNSITFAMYLQVSLPRDSLREGERAMLIKNNKGDWGIVKGHWTGFKKGQPPKVKGNVYFEFIIPWMPKG